MLAAKTIRSGLRSFRPTSLRPFTATSHLLNKQVPESMWTTHPPPPPSVAPSDRIARLPTETESDRQVLESLRSLDQYVRELYDEHMKTSGPILRGTDEVRFGRKYMGMVAMPEYIERGISQLVDKADKKQLRHDYLRIADALRSTGQITPDGKGRGRAAQQQRRDRRSPEEIKDEDDVLDMDNYPKPLPGERVEVVMSGERPKAESLVKPGTPLTPHSIEYGARESIAFLASSSPATYGV
ncbi:37S ribosomal protein S22, partial [Linderina pennispora]